jgi:hypothetical protein
MARATRSKPAAKSSQSAETEPTKSTTIAPSVQNPPKLFVLPKNVSEDARIVTLPNPATSTANRYYLCPENGIYEFVKVAAPRSTPRSLLYTSLRTEQPTSGEIKPESTEEDQEGRPSATSTSKDAFSNGYITRSADMFVATPVDLLFFLLPILSPLDKKDQKQMFLTLDDHLDSASTPLKHLFQTPSAKKLFESRLRVICDTVEAGDDTMFRLSIEKLVKEMVAKANTVVAKGLPPSMEERFVHHTLQVPVLSVKREESGISIADGPMGTTQESTSQGPRESVDTTLSGSQKRKASDDLDENTTLKRSKATDSGPTIVLDEMSQVSSIGESPLSLESQQSNASSMTSVAAEESASPSQQNSPGPEKVIHLLRLRTALKFILSSYLPPHIKQKVEQQLDLSNLIDFTPLDEHLKHLDSLRDQARALRSLSDNISRKRGLDDDEAIEAREEKKRKKEEEEKRKKMVSKSVKALKKVDTSGMKKMSSFFTKVPKK